MTLPSPAERLGEIRASELTDREVFLALRDLTRGRYSDTDTSFAAFVIPALEARGLGEKFELMLLKMLDPDSWMRYINVGDMWAARKAPLSLRARAALQVLESARASLPVEDEAK